MVPKIFVSQNLETRVGELEKILQKHGFSIPHPDLLYFDDTSKLGVEASKQIRDFLSFKPYQTKGRGVVLESAENLTPDAQNSLLKTLEEPPAESLILLGASSENSLLPTILSRCEVHVIASNQSVIMEGVQERSPNSESADFSSSTRNDKKGQEIETLINSSLAARFEFIEKLEEKEEFLQSLIHFYQKKMQIDKGVLPFVKILLEAEKWQKANGNTRAILEYLMLNLP